MISLKTSGWEIKNIDTVLFDKDGTFVDLHHFWGKITELRANAIVKHYNLPENLFARLTLSLGYNIKTKKMLSNGITALYSRVKIIEIFNKDLKELGVNSTEEKITEIFDNITENINKNLPEHIKPINEAIDFIKELRANNIKTGIVTSDSIETTTLTLKHFNWENLFDIVVGRESTVETKESGAPTRLALEKLESIPGKTIMIGDAPMDYISAKNAGIEHTILVATGQLSKKELEQSSEYVVDSLKEITCFQN